MSSVGTNQPAHIDVAHHWTDDEVCGLRAARSQQDTAAPEDKCSRHRVLFCIQQVHECKCSILERAAYDGVNSMEKLCTRVRNV